MSLFLLVFFTIQIVEFINSFSVLLNEFLFNFDFAALGTSIWHIAGAKIVFIE